ncbi:hypothetical protein [Paraburkholderia tropica]|uniref:hypothetical protein n=1 Tax=Paraburkholderia tropica TaxID=92647 RepID=UPI0007FDEDFF|nr:hypothetical protein [Paraburkholderia tropica]OBR52337.1 hypothetical protein A6456_10580 [Paraburkholderia tropica]
MANITKAERERRAAAAQGADMAEAKDKDVEQKADEIKYVKMKRDPDQYDAPHEANVHPHEVSSFSRGGWEIASE